MIKIRGFRLNLAMEIYSKVLFKKKKKDYYITSVSCYVDLAVDVTKLLPFDTIKEILDLANAILADGVDFAYEKMLYNQLVKERAIHLKLIK